MKFIYLFIASVFITGCTDDSEKSIDNIKAIEASKSPTVEEMFIRQAEAELGIPANEKYRSKIHTEELNGDDSLDFIFTVNRLDHALNKAIESDNIAQRAEMGYTGNYNYVFYMDGASKEISSAIPVASSAHAPLEISFEHIKTEAFKDILIDFRIRNSKFRRYINITNKVPRQTFEMLIYDNLGTEDAKAFSIEYGPGSYSLSKDILIYQAEMESILINDPMEIYTVSPKITSTGKLERLWFFNDYQNKYFTKK